MLFKNKLFPNPDSPAMIIKSAGFNPLVEKSIAEYPVINPASILGLALLALNFSEKKRLHSLEFYAHKFWSRLLL
jgi:hypothetical protein